MWGPFIVEVPIGQRFLGSGLLFDTETDSISWIDTNDMGGGIGIEREPEIGEEGGSIIVRNRGSEEYVIRSVREGD